MFRRLLNKMVDGFIYGFGFVFFSAIIIFTGMMLTGQTSPYMIKSALISSGMLPAPTMQSPDKIATTVLKIFNLPQTTIPDNYLKIEVNAPSEFGKALQQAHANGGSTAILLADGVYTLKSQVHIKKPGIMLLSKYGNPYNVVIKGRGMRAGGRGQSLFRVESNNFVVDGVTLSDVKNHLLQIAGEDNASYPIIRNSILQDANEQFIKVSYDQGGRPENISRGGIVENCIFQFTRGLAINYYTGGIDAIGAKDWLVKDNIFRDFASPGKHISQHAIHFWVNASGNKIIGNLIIDSDRGIGFGMRQNKRQNETLQFSSQGGEITDNVIFHSDNGDPFADTGIVIEDSPDTIIARNTIFLDHDYPRAIEYRFENSKNVLIKNNQVNKKISARDGGSASLVDNDEALTKIGFFDKFIDIQSHLNIENLYSPINQTDE
jgi:hypothetical protein